MTSLRQVTKPISVLGPRNSLFHAWQMATQELTCSRCHSGFIEEVDNIEDPEDEEEEFFNAVCYGLLIFLSNPVRNLIIHFRAHLPKPWINSSEYYLVMVPERLAVEGPDPLVRESEFNVSGPAWIRGTCPFFLSKTCYQTWLAMARFSSSLEQGCRCTETPVTTCGVVVDSMP